MRRYRNIGESGVSLLETSMALAITAILLTALMAFYVPSVQVYASVMGTEDQKLTLINMLQNIEQEASEMSAVYVDPSMCYQLCMVDPDGYRVYYYYDAADAAKTTKNLYRKREQNSNLVSCSGGQVFARNVDSTATTFSVNKNLLNVKLTGKGESGTAYANTLFSVTSSMFPTVQERSVIFSETFECGTLRAGWIVTSGSGSTWTIQSTSNQGRYQITDTESGGVSNTTTIEIPVDLQRTSTAHLKFNYMNDGTITATDSFKVEYYNGTTYQTVYSDASGQSVLSAKTIEADLTGFTFNNNNKIRFSGTLKTAGAHWYVDTISIFTP